MIYLFLLVHNLKRILYHFYLLITRIFACQNKRVPLLSLQAPQIKVSDPVLLAALPPASSCALSV